MKIRCISCHGSKVVMKNYSSTLELRCSSWWLCTYRYYDRATGERVGIPTVDAKGREGNDLYPTEECQTCEGAGWIDRETENLIIALRDK